MGRRRVPKVSPFAARSAVLFAISLIKVSWNVTMPINSTLFLGLSALSFLFGALMIEWRGFETLRSWALAGIVSGEAMMMIVGYETAGDFDVRLPTQITLESTLEQMKCLANPSLQEADKINADSQAAALDRLRDQVKELKTQARRTKWLAIGTTVLVADQALPHFLFTVVKSLSSPKYVLERTAHSSNADCTASALV